MDATVDLHWLAIKKISGHRVLPEHEQHQQQLAMYLAAPSQNEQISIHALTPCLLLLEEKRSHSHMALRAPLNTFLLIMI
jgi:hypothetical protein